MIIFLYGKDTYRSRQQLKKMIEKFRADRDPQGLNIVKVDCEKEQPGKILEQILATPFLAEKRMIALENLLISKHKELQEDLLDRIRENKLPESNVIVFWEGTDSFKTKDAKALFDILRKEKYAQKFDELTGARKQAWIEAEVKERGGIIEKDAVKYLADNVRGDMWRLSGLLDQLLAYCHPEPAESTWSLGERGNPLVNTTEYQRDSSIPRIEDSARSVGMTDKKRAIESAQGGQGCYSPRLAAKITFGDTTSACGVVIHLQDCQLFLDEKADDNIFNLVESIAAKNPKQAFQMMREQYRKGEDAGYIFAMLLRQFRILLEMRDLFEREDDVRSDALAKKLGLHPFVVKKSLPLVRRYTMEELKDIYKQLLDLDIGTKTGLGDQKMLLDIFVGRISVLSS